MEIPSAIKPSLEAYIQLLKEDAPDLVGGFYLHGSIALGAFDPAHSDIDFVAVLNYKPDPREIGQLRTIHQQIAQRFPKWALEGSYFQQGDLGKYDDEIAPGPSFHSGKFEEAGHFEVNAVTWWLLKKHGVTVLGPEPRLLDFEVDWNELLRRMDENLHSYWASWTKNRKRIFYLYTDAGIEWAVLGILRLYYTAHEQDITSKLGAGKYALLHLPKRWHRLINEAIRLRESNSASSSLYRLRLMRSVQAVIFLRYIIRITTFTRSF